jgi:hypothetical protein
LLQSIREVSGIIFVVTFIVEFQRLTFSQLSVSFSPPFQARPLFNRENESEMLNLSEPDVSSASLLLPAVAET